MAYGLFVCTAATLICFAATKLAANPIQAFSLLIAGRLVLGLGESMALVGMLSWNIALLGPQRSGTVFSLVGASLYGAFAAGGPLGLLCIEQFGFSGFMLLYSPLPLLGWLMISRMPAVLPQSAKPKGSFLSVLGAIWQQGAVVCFQGVGFAALGAFSTLYFASKGWHHPGLALTCFGIGFVAVRLLFSQLPDKMGGMRVAMASLWIAACGQLLLWQASLEGVALAGAFLTGTGCSLVYPSMGAEVIRKVRPELLGTAVGGFAMFQDVAYGATGPIVGLLADHFGYCVIFMIGFAATLLALLIATILYRGMKGSNLNQEGT